MEVQRMGKSPIFDIDDMPEITDFSKARKNPFAERIKKEGYSVTIHYSPEDEVDDKKDIVAALVDLMSNEEIVALLQHIKNNYNLPCSPNVWHAIGQ